MYFQRHLASLDKLVSKIFWLQSWGSGDENNENQWIHFVDVGRTIGVVGVDGEIHTLMGYWSVRHYYNGKKLLKRIPVRRDLKPGERLATSEEILRHQTIRRQLDQTSSGLTIS